MVLRGSGFGRVRPLQVPPKSSHDEDPSRRYRRLAGEAVFEVVEGFAEVVREPVFGV
jgi:hypothetical protein